jgi:hypothetical protein
MPHLTPEDHAEIARLWNEMPPTARLLSREANLLAEFRELRADTLAAVLFDILRNAALAEELGVGVKDMLTATAYDLVQRDKR